MNDSIPSDNLTNSEDAVAAAELLAESTDILTEEVGKRIVGHKNVIEQLLIALFCEGHCLFIGVPGLGKTLLVRTLAECLELQFSRIQFTPDLMPADITGTDIIQVDPATNERRYEFAKGPIFANVILADEINRAPPKTQSALLQAMQERHVTATGRRYDLSPPFFVLATQNPIEQEGTYPLPEAQLDRFMFSVHLDYPDHEEEEEIIATTTSDYEPQIEKVMSGEEVVRVQNVVRQVEVSEDALDYAVRLARATRPENEDAPEFVSDWVSWGAGPRAPQAMVLGGKARALINGRYAVSRDDVAYLARTVLNHRIIPGFSAEAEGIDTFTIIERLLEAVPR